MKDQVLKVMREAGKPMSAGEVTKALEADRKEVDKAFAEYRVAYRLTTGCKMYLKNNFF